MRATATFLLAGFWKTRAQATTSTFSIWLRSSRSEMRLGMFENADFTEEQKQYLQGFAAGSGLVQKLSLNVLPTFQSTLNADPNCAAQDKVLAEGKKLVSEEEAKRKIGH